ncbi:MAG: tryptophan synthase subunit alpha [Chthoniobacterales bacterium]|nr:tryptophan synthase subunit alpha [Chthoniobacterales bacterium]
MTPLARAFENLQRENRCGFIPFLVAGDPDLQTTPELIAALTRSGATAIEVGVPFSDPTADGSVIQRAAQRALNRATTLAAIFQMLHQLRSTNETPLVLFSYYNPILQFGLRKFADDAARCGVGGVLVTDLPPEAAEPLRALLSERAIDLIFLVAPTTSDARLQQIAKLASGFIYAIARTGVTGTHRELVDESATLVQRIRSVSTLPVAVGFGITKRAQVKTVCAYADAAVVGSRLVAEIEEATASAKWRRAELIERVERCARQFGSVRRSL